MGRKKRRQGRDGAEVSTRRRPRNPRPERKPPGWLDELGGWGWTALVVGTVIGAIGAHYALWHWVIPPVGAVVGRIPVVSTVVGWLFGGGAWIALGVAVLNEKTASKVVGLRLVRIALVWMGVAVLCLPVGWAEDIHLPTDYWAGVFAGAYGLLGSLVVFPVLALVLYPLSRVVRPLRDRSDQVVGWASIGYGVLLLVWGSTLLRM
ncbi:hypothetical protein AB0K14_36395 [Actinosynnema sp. NPDC050801]|uniref:hypothetical protein n=1 Tax=unclassified Actinosynnema TaxID=2637065 RepID=UPI0033FF9AD5